MAKKILLIEDEDEQIELYSDALNLAGFEVETIKWGYKALESIEKIKEGKMEKPDLVLLDLVLLDINGIEILEKARGEEETKDIPFFILTNFTDPELKEIGEKLKVEKYIVKTDVTPLQLAKIIKEWFKK